MEISNYGDLNHRYEQQCYSKPINDNSHLHQLRV